jgi:hypothetical protein
VRIIGPGIIVNEPCGCSGNFPAKVRFKLNNNTGTQRYCVTVHLCDGRNVDGQVVVPAQDLIVGTVDPGEKFYEVTIPNYPCGAGNVCFGEAGSGEDGGFAKVETCPTGKCCTVISWNVRPGDPCPLPHANIIKSKCRAQQVCIQGRGKATLDCNPATAAIDDDCNADCAGNGTLRLCTTGGVAPFVFALSDNWGNTYNYSSLSADGRCATYNVKITQDTTFTGTVTDENGAGCATSDTTTLRLVVLPPPVLSDAQPDCEGNVTITASPAGLANYHFKDGNGVTLQNGASNVLTRQFAPGDHCVTCTARNSAGCESTSDPECFTVLPLVPTPALSVTGPDCDGNTVISITNCPATGITFTFEDAAGNPLAGDTDNSACTFTKKFAPGTYTVYVRASNGRATCDKTAQTAPFTIYAPVNTSLNVSGNGACNDGILTFTASASGGNQSYTFEWKVDGSTTLPANASLNGAGNVLTYKPRLAGSGGLDTVAHTVSCQAFDTSGRGPGGAGCGGDIETRRVEQCLSSTVSTVA